MDKKLELGIAVEPSQVRLITGPDDPYSWTWLPEKQHLFGEHMVKRSVGACMKLCRDVDVLFEAIVADTSTHCTGQVRQQGVARFRKNVSFAARIRYLEEQNTRLANRVGEGSKCSHLRTTLASHQ